MYVYSEGVKLVLGMTCEMSVGCEGGVGGRGVESEVRVEYRPHPPRQ